MRVDSENRNMNNDQNADLGLVDLFAIIWKRKLIVLAGTVLFAIASVLIALSLPNIYRSETLISPAATKGADGIGALAGQLGGLASLAGISMPTNDAADKVSMAIDVMKSRTFLKEFIDKYEILPDLIAAKSWNPSDNTINYDPELFDSENNQWVREAKFPYGPKPSLNEAHKEFLKIFDVARQKDSSLIKVSVKHPSPLIAQKWADAIVHEINAIMKHRDLQEAEVSISYLMAQLEETEVSDMRVILHSLVQEHTKTKMFANVRKEYIFKVVDPAYLPEEKAEPSRALIVILGTFFGFIVSSLGALLFAATRRNKKIA
ncbi:Wzz/FepE/Etk N-terminal domain-containing protein [Pseudoalteromonas luteoviolacea]|uniref:Wzz/FepE/Etk N-terminal domain-containing protein n=1 Tax=Pseudoalteromonas luteoviolacea TaxID=43657 RepID=UPI00115437E5|nr:Wzz/FepE/Etk N-terminal domain-containing protein [Pseudoalteromonas luteoviolacea]TQF72213.1 LPS O-antigen length regulator [Pseudoalteromonas luteoviolacea]